MPRLFALKMAMERKRVIKLISQYLYEHDFPLTLKALEAESGSIFRGESILKTGELESILDEHEQSRQERMRYASSVFELFEQGEGEYVQKLLCSTEDFSDGENLLVVRMTRDGGIVLGSSKGKIIMGEVSLPLTEDSTTSIPTERNICKGAVLCLDFHPKQRNILLGGSMDRSVLVLDLEKEDPLVQKFQNHSKYVVRCLWAPSGSSFVTGSYDRTVCTYSKCADGSYQKKDVLRFKGAVEALCFKEELDIFVVGIRDDNMLHCYDLSSGSALKLCDINLNSFGDNYVSFTPMHLSFSPGGKCLLISTDHDRLILIQFEEGKQIANFYGAANDEFSQPRHCWDPSGRYIYSTSQDNSICVWEVRSQKVVKRLEGHTNTVRDLQFCEELGVLVSCSYDTSVKLWK